MEKSNLNPTVLRAQEALKKYWYVPSLLIVLALLFLAGPWYGKTVAGQNAAGGRRILHYVDPMNPAHTSPEPGLAPCGMKMEPVYADDGGQAANSAMPPGSVKITPEKQQIIGVRVAMVEKSPWTYTLRTVGKVVVDETRSFRLNAFVEGWVVRIYHNTTGSLVRKDEPLATLYNRDLPTTLQTFYYALDAVDRMNQDPNLLSSQHDLLVAQKLSAEGVLMNLGLGKPQLDDLARSRKLTQEIILSAPATSFVLTRNITSGQRFAAGEELYRLADLSRVWVLADLFENEAKYVRPGEKVSVTLPNQDEKRLATVSEILPEFDPATVTLKARLEMDNPRFTLRPGMFVDVEFPIKQPATVNVPVEAIMDSGLKQTIFVDRGNGYFEPRRVKTGWRLGDRVEIVEGLEAGERIVISGNFLIDSESRMKLAAAGFFGNVVKDPVCGMDLDEAKAGTAGLKMEHQGKGYYFCSEACQKQFNKTPERYVAKPEVSPAHKQGESPPKGQIAPEKIQDPVCGHEIDETQTKAAGLSRDYDGKTYYFCSHNCKKQFDQDPAHYVHQEAPASGGVSKTQAAATNVKDPVCSLEVAKEAAKGAGRTSEYQGKVYYFDTDGCKQRFDHDPQRYLAGNSGATPVAIQPYPSVPLETDVQTRYKRTLMRMAPQGPAPTTPSGATPPAPPGAPPATPAGPTPPMAHPGAAPAVAPVMPHAGAQVTPPAATPAAPQGITPAAPQGPAPVKPPEQPTPPPQAPQAAQMQPPQPQAPLPAPPLCPPGGGGHLHD